MKNLNLRANNKLQKMYKLAKDVQKKAYTPYSKFNVGACILAENEVMYVGCNIENASYPQGWCAECSAISAMIVNGAKKIKEILIIGGGEELCTPCGGCRQKIREFASSSCLIHIANGTSILKTFTLEELLPHSFASENLH